MTAEEAKKTIDSLKEQGKTDEELLVALYGLYQQDHIDINELGDLVQLVGYELTDDFKNMPPEEQKTQGIEKDESIGKNDEAIEGKEPDEPSASKVEVKDKDDEPSQPEEKDEKDNESSSSSSELTPEEEEQARSLYGFNKK